MKKIQKSLLVAALAVFSLSASADYVDINTIESSDVAYNFNYSLKKCVTISEAFEGINISSDNLIQTFSGIYPDATVELTVIGNLHFVSLDTNTKNPTTMLFTNNLEACEKFRAVNIRNSK